MLDSKRIIFIILIVMCFFGCDSNIKNDFSKDEEVKKRVGMVIKLNPEFIEVYKQLHSDNNPGVRDLLRKYGMRNFSIFLHEITPGEFYEFGYYEYVGDDFKKDMDAMVDRAVKVSHLGRIKVSSVNEVLKVDSFVA